MGAREYSGVERRFGFAIHLLTASGAACAFLALFAAAEHAWSALFAWLGLALIIDAIDGPLARRFGIDRALPRWSGVTLDLVVDFVTYVFVPAYAIAGSGLLPPLAVAPAGVAIVTTGAIYFADQQMKLPDHSFSGFPALWNLVAFYFLLLRPSPWIGTAIVAVFCVATFAPISFIHPIRVVRMRRVTLAAVTLWGVLAVLAIARDMSPGPWITGALCAIAFYIVAVGLWPKLGHDRPNSN